MGDFATGTPELKKAADDMVSTNQQLQDAGSQLAAAVESVEGAWKGAAQTAFNNLMQQYAADFKNLNDTLFNIAEQTTGSADTYQQQEDQAAQDISSIMSTLDG
jgi:WXG100 family type VII secretion target